MTKYDSGLDGVIDAAQESYFAAETLALLLPEFYETEETTLALLDIVNRYSHPLTFNHNEYIIKFYQFLKPTFGQSISFEGRFDRDSIKRCLEKVPELATQSLDSITFDPLGALKFAVVRVMGENYDY